MIDVTDALQHVDLASRDQVYHTCRALLVHRHDQLAVFDRAFEMFWSAQAGGRTSVKGASRPGESGRGSSPIDWPTSGEVDAADEGTLLPALVQT